MTPSVGMEFKKVEFLAVTLSKNIKLDGTCKLPPLPKIAFMFKFKKVLKTHHLLVYCTGRSLAPGPVPC